MQNVEGEGAIDEDKLIKKLEYLCAVLITRFEIGPDISSLAEIRGNGLSHFSACHRLTPTAYSRCVFRQAGQLEWVITYIDNRVYEGKTKDTFEAYNGKKLLWIR